MGSIRLSQTLDQLVHLNAWQKMAHPGNVLLLGDTILCEVVSEFFGVL